MRLPPLLLLSLLLAACDGTTAPEQPPGLAIAEHNGCLGCHEVDRDGVGPSFREIAARYHGVPDAEEQLFAKVKHGGKGAWGEKLAMPHNMQIPDDRIRALVRWVLALSADGSSPPSQPSR
jgi:cytochrome c551/c552